MRALGSGGEAETKAGRVCAATMYLLIKRGDTLGSSESSKWSDYLEWFFTSSGDVLSAGVMTWHLLFRR